MTKQQELLLDYDFDEAKDIIDDFRSTYQTNLALRIATLARAMQEFNQFLNLPNNPSLAEAIFGAVRTTLFSLVPALGLGKVLTNVSTRAGYEITITKQLLGEAGRRMDRAKKAGADAILQLGAAADTTNEIAKAVEDVKNSAKGAAAAATPGVAAMIDSHASKGIIGEMAASVKQVRTAANELDHMVNVIKLYRKLVDDYSGPKLVDLVTQKLPHSSESLSSRDLEEVRLAYLYLMIEQWANGNVKWIVTKMTRPYHVDDNKNVTPRLSGVTDGQHTQINTWFHAGILRGRYFTPARFPAAVPGTNTFFQRLKLTTETEIDSRDYQKETGFKV